MQGTLARKLRVLRAERGLTLTEAAERAGVQRQTLALLERGERHPHTPTLSKIAKGYGVPVEELLEEPALPLAEAPREAGHTSWQAAYEELGDDLLSRWEDELEKKLRRADDNPQAFFDWVEEVRRVGRAYLDELISVCLAGGDRLAAVVGVAPFLGRWNAFWRRLEEATLSSPKATEELQGIVEEVRAENEAFLAA